MKTVTSHGIDMAKLRKATINRAAALLGQGEYSGADALLQTVADDVHPDPLVQHLRALAVAGLGQTERARELLSISIRLDPADATAHANLGALLGRDYLHAPAAAAFEAALLLDPANAAALAGCAKSYAELGLFDLAIASYRQAISAIPDDLTLKVDLAALLSDAGDIDEAMRLFTEALANATERADFHTARAMSLFNTGDWLTAWQEYEWRWRDPRYRSASTPLQTPRWQSEDLRDKTILLQAEQGLGDTIQFVRYVPRVKALGCRVVLQLQNVLLPLMQSLTGVDELIGADDEAPPCDVWAPLLSLPGLFETTLDTVPDIVPYLHVDPALAEKWKRRLDLRPGLRVGLAWQGNPAHPCDRWRSMRLGDLHPLHACPNVQFISLQHGAGSEQLSGIGRGIIDPAAKHPISSFSDTAAIVENLDLVISVDSSVAHLAGALGKPVWLLLAARNDWRWMRGHDHTPWYPQMKIFRQTSLHDWDTVVAQVQQDLWSWAGAAQFIDAPARQHRVDETAICHALFARGARLHRDGDIAAAASSFERLLGFNPDNVHALSNLGAIEGRRGNNTQALTLLRRALAIAPESIETRTALADTHFSAGDHTLAADEYRNVLRLAPRNATAHAGLALSCHALGDFSTAIKHFETAAYLDQRQPAPFYHALGQTLVALERLPAAAISFEHALALDASLASAHEALQLLRRQLQLHI